MRSHIDKTVIIGYNTITTVIAEDYLACTGFGNQLTIGIVCEGIGNISTCIGNCNRTASEIEMVGFERTAHFFTNQAVAIDIFGGDTVGCLAEQLAELGTNILSIPYFVIFGKIKRECAPSCSRMMGRSWKLG